VEGTMSEVIDELVPMTTVDVESGRDGGDFIAQLFVSPNGNNSNTGRSPNSPLRTINEAFKRSTPGNTISVADGTYTGDVEPSKAGSASGGYVTLRAANKHGAKIVGELLITKQYIEIRDMEITGADVRFACDVTADNVTIRGNKIHDICRHAVDDDGGSAIEVYSADGDYSEMHNIVIDANVVYNIGRKPGADELTQGIYVSGKCTDGRITNNLVYGVCDFGIHAFHRPESWTVANNTVVGCGRGILTAKNFKVRNNISYNNLSDNYDVRGSGNQLSNNIAFGTGGGSGITGVTRVDPKLVKPVITGSGDFTLRPDSPARNAGTATGAPATDIIGTSRPQGPSYDMGAYEMGVSGSGELH
jgi:Right handed beta helix region